MKTRSSNMQIILLASLFFLEIIAYGIIKSIDNSKLVSEVYHAEITMGETVMLDDQSIIKRYGKPIYLEYGTLGEINDVIDWYGEKHGYKHIRAKFILLDGEILNVILNNEMDSEFIDNSVPVIDINKVNDSQKVISEFNQMRDKYTHSVNQTLFSGIIISVIIATIMVSIILILKCFIHNNSVEKVLVFVVVCFDVMMPIISLFELYFSGWY